MSAVSRETLAEPERITRPYRSGRRQRNAAATRQAMIDAVLTLVEKGNFRPEGRDVARLVGCDGSLVTYHFGSLDGLLQVIAEDHAAAIVRAAGIETAAPVDVVADLAWLILVGRKRSAS